MVSQYLSNRTEKRWRRETAEAFDRIRARTDELMAREHALKRLVGAARACALRQPAVFARTQADADRWGRFYEALHDAETTLQDKRP